VLVAAAEEEFIPTTRIAAAEAIESNNLPEFNLELEIKVYLHILFL